MGVVDKDIYGYREGYPYTTSWGGSVQFDASSSKYIMIVSEYAAECPNWGHNSAVILATSVRMLRLHLATPIGTVTYFYSLAFSLVVRTGRAPRSLPKAVPTVWRHVS